MRARAYSLCRVSGVATALCEYIAKEGYLGNTGELNLKAWEAMLAAGTAQCIVGPGTKLLTAQGLRSRWALMKKIDEKAAMARAEELRAQEEKAAAAERNKKQKAARKLSTASKKDKKDKPDEGDEGGGGQPKKKKAFPETGLKA